MTAPDTTPKALRALAKEVDALIVDWDRREIRERAVAALLAIAEKMETLVMVPKEPTEKMLDAGIGPFAAAHDLMFCQNEPCGPIYKAMLAAAEELKQ
jgi:hypothetical protein